MIIDSHCHIWEYHDIKNWYTYSSNINELLTILTWNNIEKAICSPEPNWWLSYKTISNYSNVDNIPYLQDNISLLEIKKDYDIDNIILPFWIVDTRTKVKDQIRIAQKKLQDKNIHWIKFHCQVLDVKITDIDNPYIMSFLKESKLPVLLHSGIRKNDWLSSKIFDIVEKYPEINFSIAHMWRFEKEFWDICEKKWVPSNLFIDTSPFYTICRLSDEYTQENIIAKILNMDYKKVKECFKEFSEKYQNHLMRGSDYPYISYPLHQWSYKENIDLIDTLDGDVKEKISSKNALKFLWYNNL